MSIVYNASSDNVEKALVFAKKGNFYSLKKKTKKMLRIDFHIVVLQLISKQFTWINPLQSSVLWLLRSRPQVSGYFLIRNLFFPG